MIYEDENNEDLYDKDVLEDALENDEINDSEEAFIIGYMDY